MLKVVEKFFRSLTAQTPTPWEYSEKKQMLSLDNVANEKILSKPKRSRKRIRD